MKKIKILYISHSSVYNGAEMVLLNLLKFLDRKRFEPVVVFPEPGPLKAEVEGLGIKTYTCYLERWIRYDADHPIEGTTIYSRIKNIHEIMEKEAIDLVHTNTAVVIDGAVAAKIRNIPHVWHVNETLDTHPELRLVLPLPMTFWCMSYLSDTIVIPADAVKEQFLCTVKPEKLYKIYNGIDDADYRSPGTPSIRSELGLTEEDIMAVTVAAVTERKGYPGFLKAASMVKNKVPRIKFVWVGNGPPAALSDFSKKTSELGLQDSIIRTGFRNDFTRFIMSADMLVHPSINEAFPMVILDAMGAGKPVIATDCGGVTESVVDGETGFVVPTNDPESLSEKIVVLAEDREIRRSIGEKGLKRFKEHFTAEIMARRFEELYQKLLSAGKTREMTEGEKVFFDSALEAYQNRAREDQRLFEKDCMIADRDLEISKKDRLLEVMDQKMANRDYLLADMEASIQTIHNSLSWKVTWPMRKTLSLLSGKKG